MWLPTSPARSPLLAMQYLALRSGTSGVPAGEGTLCLWFSRWVQEQPCPSHTAPVALQCHTSPPHLRHLLSELMMLV